MAFGDHPEMSQPATGISSADHPTPRGLCSCGNIGAKRGRTQSCITIYGTPIEQPDLATYSQAAAFADNVAPTWNNPYIVIHDWPSYRSLTEASVKIHNLSATTAALNSLVHFYTSPFGIGTARQLRLTQMIDVAPRAEVVLSFPLARETIEGSSRVGIHVRIEHPFDVSRLDNEGSKVVRVVDTGGGRRRFEVPIPVVNESSGPLEIQLSLLPNALTATLSPLLHRFAPFEQLLADLHVEVPASLTGTPADPKLEEVTVVARASETGELIGGATLLVRIVD